MTLFYFKKQHGHSNDRGFKFLQLFWQEIFLMKMTETAI